MNAFEPRRHEGDISPAQMALLRAADPDACKIAAYLARGEVWVDAQKARPSQLFSRTARMYSRL
jgi:hypothetical protein